MNLTIENFFTLLDTANGFSVSYQVPLTLHLSGSGNSLGLFQR